MAAMAAAVKGAGATAGARVAARVVAVTEAAGRAMRPPQGAVRHPRHRTTAEACEAARTVP